MSGRLVAVPCNVKQANLAVQAWHRHHSPLGDAAFCVAVATEDDMVVRGIAMVGRPASNGSEDGVTCEVRRVATDGTPNACSKLLGLCRRVAMTLGYKKVQTYTMESEGGASLRAAGWADEHRTDGHSHFSNRVKARSRGSKYGGRRVGKQARMDRERQQGTKVRWAVDARDGAPAPVWPDPPHDDHPTLPFDEGSP